VPLRSICLGSGPNAPRALRRGRRHWVSVWGPCPLTKRALWSPAAEDDVNHPECVPRASTNPCVRRRLSVPHLPPAWTESPHSAFPSRPFTATAVRDLTLPSQLRFDGSLPLQQCWRGDAFRCPFSHTVPQKADKAPKLSRLPRSWSRWRDAPDEVPKPQHNSPTGLPPCPSSNTPH
jgi:hypothetical protein